MSTHYRGPEKVSVFKFGGRALRLARPAEPDRLLEDPGVLAWNARDDYMPYWAYLWPGAFLLAEAVAGGSWPAGQRALEIGCGLGLAGLVGVGRGLRVRFTDYDEAPLRFVERSAAANGFDPALYATQRLDWRALPDERFPVILAADVLYEPRLVPLVADLLATMLEPGGAALVAGAYRSATEGFADAVQERGLTCLVSHVTADTDELGPVRGTLHRVGRQEEQRPAKKLKPR